MSKMVLLNTTIVIYKYKSRNDKMIWMILLTSTDVMFLKNKCMYMIDMKLVSKYNNSIGLTCRCTILWVLVMVAQSESMKVE